jgi:hypothetical protein
LSGLSPAATTKAHRDECEDYCKNLASGEPSSSEEKSADDDGTMKESNHQQRRHRKRSSGKSAIVIYNWQNIDPLNMDSKMGKCECITVLHSIRLSYGSFSGFII